MNAYGLEIEVYSVSQITDRVTRLLQADAVLADVWVSGEISNFTHHSSGHMYMTLKDDASRLRAVMFQGANRGLRFRPESGMRVFAHGYVGVYRSGGEYQLYIDFMEPAGLGGLFLAFQQLKAKLEAEGLFDPALKRPLPRFPKRIAVATSPTGAAVRDIITVARRRWPAIHIVIIPTLVQGEGAPASIVCSIEHANALAEAGGADGIDVLIVGRGGGSAEELWAFNDEMVARAIRSSRVPVVSAVGHETDFTIADFAADVRAATPSAAAELVVPDIGVYLRQLETERTRLVRSVRRLIDQRRQRVDELRRWHVQKTQTRFRASRERVQRLAGVLSALDPQAVLGRGYAICRGPDGAVLKDSQSVRTGDTVSVKLGRGAIGCEVREVVQG
ncbi:MAG TPA: exodeoxyribonuclease VII large subunit [Bacillota bacterium]|nr:exodeoxyribonuclease VII large subunit [Bacillota bacterium]